MRFNLKIQCAIHVISRLEESFCFSQVLYINLAVITIDIIAISMTFIMIRNIKSKYTAVGRKEIVMFFYLYFLNCLLELLLVSNIISFSSPVYNVIIVFSSILRLFILQALQEHFLFLCLMDSSASNGLKTEQVYLYG